MEQWGPLPREGQVVAGRYRIERLLAKGGHGAVFVAEQIATEAAVALKLLSPTALESHEARRRFELEAKVAGRVKSEFIVRVLDAGIDDSTGCPYLAMELLEGESLAQHVQRMGPMSEVDIVTCMLQVAQGLDKAHSSRTRDGKPAPIIHRDLKPENLLTIVREDGQRITKIVDFGIARVINESLTASQGIKGSPLYIAYEQLAGGELSHKTDLWPLGLIAFFLLTGRHYWRSCKAETVSVSSVFSEILHFPIVAPRARIAELGGSATWPPAFDDWFLKCVSRDPAARFGTAGEAARALAQALLGRDSEHTLPSKVMIESAPVLPGISSDGSHEIDEEDPDPVARTSPVPAKRSRLLLASIGVLVLLLPVIGYLAAGRGSRLAPPVRTTAGSAGAGSTAKPPEPPRDVSPSDAVTSPSAAPPTGASASSAPTTTTKDGASPMAARSNSARLKVKSAAARTDKEGVLSSPIFQER